MKQLIPGILFVLFSQAGIAGNGAGGGADSYNDLRAWFLGPGKTITSCIKLSPQFGVDSETAIGEIRSVYRSWSDYLVDKNLAWDFGSTPVMSMQIEVRSQCKGGEDLTFYLGVEDALVKAAKQRYIKPYGFAERISFDEEKAWSKGFIWIAMPSSVGEGVPNWTFPHTLHGILLHEIGHTLGNGHITATIMDENFGWVIQSQTKDGFNNWGLTHIDGLRELHVCRKCGGEFIGQGDELMSGYLSAAFLFLTGSSPVGKPTAKFAMTAEGKVPVGLVSYSDDKGTYSFQVTSTAQVSEVSDSGIAFLAEFQHAGPFAHPLSYSYFGTLEGPGKHYNIIVNRNTYGLIQIVRAENGQMLFWSTQRKENRVNR